MDYFKALFSVTDYTITEVEEVVIANPDFFVDLTELIHNMTKTDEGKK